MLKLLAFPDRVTEAAAVRKAFSADVPVRNTADQVELGCRTQISSLIALPFRDARTRSRVKEGPIGFKKLPLNEE